MQIFVRQFRNRETCHPAIWWNTTSPNCVIMHKRTNKTAKSSHLHGLYDFPISLAYVHVSHVFTNSSLPLSFCKSKEMFFVHLDHAARERYMKNTLTMTNATEANVAMYFQSENDWYKRAVGKADASSFCAWSFFLFLLFLLENEEVKLRSTLVLWAPILFEYWSVVVVVGGGGSGGGVALESSTFSSPSSFISFYTGARVQTSRKNSQILSVKLLAY